MESGWTEPEAGEGAQQSLFRPNAGATRHSAFQISTAQADETIETVVQARVIAWAAWFFCGDVYRWDPPTASVETNTRVGLLTKAPGTRRLACPAGWPTG